MKKLLVLCAGMMLLASSAMAQQGLHMSWINCPNQPGASPTEIFPCDGAQTHNLNGTFSLAASTPGVVAVDGIMDMAFSDRVSNTPVPVPPFWQFQQGGCNETGIIINGGKPAAGCGTNLPSTGNTNALCGSGGSLCSSVITAYAFGASINFPENRSRLLFTLARSASNPVTLAANTGVGAHFAFTFTFFEDNATGLGLGECAGCAETAVGMTWNQAIFYNTAPASGLGGEGIAANLSSADPGSANASTGVNCVACVSVSNRTRSWGQLKSLYR